MLAKSLDHAASLMYPEAYMKNYSHLDSLVPEHGLAE